MISLLLIIISSITLLGCLIWKVFCKKQTGRIDRIVSLIMPLICLLLFLCIFLFNASKRKADNRELGILLSTILDTKLSNRVYNSNEDKCKQVEYLNKLLSKVDSIADDNIIVSFISGKSLETENKIIKTKEIIQNNLKWLNRLNDFYCDSIKYDVKKESINTIRLIEPPTDSLQVLNLAFTYTMPIDSVICTYVEILHDDEIIYKRAFINKSKVNCFNLPNFSEHNVRLALGYIKQENSKFVFNYINYGRK